VIVYRLTVPFDDFEDFVPVTDWIRAGSPQDVAWILTAVLALQDAGLGWDGEMRHLPSVGVPTDRTATEPYLIVKQDNNGDTFVISANPASWAEAGCARVEDVRPRRIAAFTHPTAEEIREAMSDLLPPCLYHREWDNDAF
jgi:hypothetical protein